MLARVRRRSCATLRHTSRQHRRVNERTKPLLPTSPGNVAACGFGLQAKPLVFPSSACPLSQSTPTLAPVSPRCHLYAGSLAKVASLTRPAWGLAVIPIGGLTLPRRSGRAGSLAMGLSATETGGFEPQPKVQAYLCPTQYRYLQKAPGHRHGAWCTCAEHRGERSLNAGARTPLAPWGREARDSNPAWP